MKNADKLFMLGLAAVSVGCKSVEQGKQPNIIFILTDDQRWDALGYAGNPYIHTPNLDSLASNGIYFQNTYATTAISCASRASILSGMYASGSGIHDFSTPFTDGQFSMTYPQLLREAGYYTGFIGKFGVGQKYDGIPEKFDFWRSFPGQGWYYNEKKGQTEHLTSIQGKQILEFLDSAPTDKPFCLSVSFKAPHCQDEARRFNGEEFPIDARDSSLYDGVVFPEPHSANHYAGMKQEFRHSEAKDKENEGRIRWEYRFDTPEKYQNTVRKYYSLISGVDREIGNMMTALKEKGLDKNTVIIFMGDNGFYLGEHGLAGKWFAHEESARLPFFIYDPRSGKDARGIKESHLALNIDVAPTILGLAGVKIPESMQGMDLSPVIAGKNIGWRKDFLYEHRYNPKGVHIPSCEGIVTENYKLLKYFADGNEWWEMYDMQKDRHETTNVIDSEEYSVQKQELEKRLAELKQEIGIAD